MKTIEEIKTELEKLIQDKQEYIEKVRGQYLTGVEIEDFLVNDNVFNAAVTEQVIKSLRHFLYMINQGEIKNHDDLNKRKDNYNEYIIDLMDEIKNKSELDIYNRVSMKKLMYIYRLLEKWVN